MDAKELSKLIVKTYRKTIWKKTIKAIDEYKMIEEGDTVGVCISGGKDSFLLACVLKEIQRHYKLKFNLQFIVMNPGYTADKLKDIKNNAKYLDIPITIFDAPIFEAIIDEKNPCYVCARKRRGYLYNKAQELGCNKIALGHHFDDVIETIMLNILYNGSYGSMLPKLKSDHYENMELIRPLYLVREYDILKWTKRLEIDFIDCACKMTKAKNDSKRQEMKELIKKLKENYEDVDKNIFSSSKNINLNTVLGYYDQDDYISFLQKY